jgi:hypothetical protein
MEIGTNAGFVYEGVSNYFPVLEINMRLNICKEHIRGNEVL